MLIFAERNEKLRQLFQREFPNIPTVKDAFAVERALICTCSNPSFSMGGGLDGEITKRYPSIATKAGLLRAEPGSVIQAVWTHPFILCVTVDQDIKADEAAIAQVLRSIRSIAERSYMPIVFTGMGTGIGGLAIERFIQICKEILGYDVASD